MGLMDNQPHEYKPELAAGSWELHKGYFSVDSNGQIDYHDGHND